MQSNIENLGALERRLSVSVPHETIETEMENRLKRLARTAKIPGFRPGKVPMKIVLQQYGPQVRQEVLGDVLQQSFSEAVREQKLRIAGSPRFEPKAAAESASEFEFSATFEVYPEVVLGDLSAVGIEQPVVKVVPADVDKTLEVVRKQRVQTSQQNGQLSRMIESTLIIAASLMEWNLTAAKPRGLLWCWVKASFSRISRDRLSA